MPKQLTYKSGFTIIEMLATISVIAILSSTVFLGQQSFNSHSSVRVRADDILSTLQLAQTLSSGSLASNIGRHSVSAYAVRIKPPSVENSIATYTVESIKSGVNISDIKEVNFNTFDNAEIVHGPSFVEEQIKYSPCFVVKTEMSYIDTEASCLVNKKTLDTNVFIKNVDLEILVVYIYPFREPTIFLSDGIESYPDKISDFNGHLNIVGAKINISTFNENTLYSIDIFNTGALFLNRVDKD